MLILCSDGLIGKRLRDVIRTFLRRTGSAGIRTASCSDRMERGSVRARFDARTGNRYSPALNRKNDPDRDGLQLTDLCVLPLDDRFLMRVPDPESTCAAFERETHRKVLRLNDGEGVLITGERTIVIRNGRIRFVSNSGLLAENAEPYYNKTTVQDREEAAMNAKDVLHELRTKNGLSQEELAEKVFVTRQAVSRWETGETVPNTETLKLLSRLYNVSINTLLGSPRQLICQCCGMPLEDSILGRDRDGALNENYCQWCYADGTYTYSDMDDLINVCVGNMVSDNFSEEQARAYLKQTLPALDYWKRYEELSDNGEFEAFKQRLIEEINDLKIEGMPKVEKLNALVGKFVNLAYRLPGGESAKFLNDGTTYLGTQLEPAFGCDRCFGVLANMEFILICTYGKDGADPELVLYKKR